MDLWRLLLKWHKFQQTIQSLLPFCPCNKIGFGVKWGRVKVVNSPQRWGSYGSLVPELVNYILEGKISQSWGFLRKTTWSWGSFVCFFGFWLDVSIEEKWGKGYALDSSWLYGELGPFWSFFFLRWDEVPYLNIDQYRCTNYRPGF